MSCCLAEMNEITGNFSLMRLAPYFEDNSNMKKVKNLIGIDNQFRLLCMNVQLNNTKTFDVRYGCMI